MSINERAIWIGVSGLLTLVVVILIGLNWMKSVEIRIQESRIETIKTAIKEAQRDELQCVENLAKCNCERSLWERTAVEGDKALQQLDRSLRECRNQN